MSWKLVGSIGLGLVLAVGALALYGSLRWRSVTSDLRDRLEAARRPVERGGFDTSELAALPAPVRRYLRTALTEGQPVVAAVSLEHTGTFNMDVAADRWRPFTSTQRVVTDRPGFDWNATVRMMPGLPVRVHDAYVAGQGTLHAAVLGVLSVVNLRDTEDTAEGELLRFLAEAPWYPTVLLPRQGMVRWDAVDDRSARATLSDGDLAVSLLFVFSEDGLIDTVGTDARNREVGGAMVPTPWQGRFWNYTVRHGMRIPLEGEVAWLLPEGARPYWRGRLVDAVYEFGP